MNNQNPYLVAIELVQRNPGTGGQAGLAKCILSLFNKENAFSIAEVLGPLDHKYTDVVLAMVCDYAKRGETEELRQAGMCVIEKFPRLMELSIAMGEARSKVRQGWGKQYEDEMRRLYPDD